MILASVILLAASALHVMWGNGELDLAQTTAEKRVHRMAYAGDVMKFDRPWEGDGCGYFHIVEDVDAKGKLYRLYYMASSCTDFWVTKRNEFKPRPAVAESRDGLNWTRPNLGICTYGGSKENNLLFADDCEFPDWDNFYVFRDPNPACPPEERYKGVAQKGDPYMLNRTGQKGAKREFMLYCYTSADGLHFNAGRKLIGGNETELKFDSLNTMCWDAARGVYRVYCRGLHTPGPNAVYCNWKVRDIRMIESKDCKTWTKPRPIEFIGDDTEEVPLYTNGIFPYFRDPSILTGLPTRYIQREKWTPNYDNLPAPDNRKWRMKRGEPRYGLAITDCIFMFTRDGLCFERSGEAVMTPGPENVAMGWSYGSCYPSFQPLLTANPLGGDPLMSFYTKEGQWMKTGTVLRRYTIRQDGFISRHAGVKPAKVVTKPLLCDGAKMLVNFSTSARGHLYVTVKGAGGKEVRSIELFGDRVDREVAFATGDLGALKGSAVTVEFGLLDCDLYSFRFVDGGEIKE